MTVDLEHAAITKVAGAQDTLARLLKKRPALDKVRVEVGAPVGGLALEHVFVSGIVEEWTQQWSTSGQGGPAGIDEEFTLTALIYVRQKPLKGDYTPVRNRALELLLEIQEQLREDFTIGEVLEFSTITGGKWHEGVTEDGRDVLLEVQIKCVAHLTAGVTE